MIKLTPYETGCLIKALNEKKQERNGLSCIPSAYDMVMESKIHDKWTFITYATPQPDWTKPTGPITIRRFKKNTYIYQETNCGINRYLVNDKVWELIKEIIGGAE